MKIITLSKESEYSVILEAVLTLKTGGVIVVPTDTVYGLCVDAKNAGAIEKIFAVKARQKENPIPVFVNSFDMLDDVAYVDLAAKRNFLEKIWPGKITSVLSSRGWMPLELRGKDKLNIGVRMPDYKFLFTLIKSFGGPIAETSANLSGRPDTNKIDDVILSFKDMPLKPDLVINAGDLPESLSSTVLDCAVWPPKIIRQGAVGQKEIEKCLKME